MKTCWKVCTITLLFLLVVMSSCNSTHEVIPTASPSIPYTLTSTPTNAHIPITLTPTIQPDITPTFFPTVTLIPSLPANKAKEQLIELLNNNGGCRLPCVLGIAPGETNIREARSMLYAYRNIAPDDFYFDVLGGGTTLKIMESDLSIQTSLIIVGNRETQSDIVRRIEMSLITNERLEYEHAYEDIDVFGSPFYAQYFHYYSISNLLLTYGLPENIYVSIWYGRDIGGGDDLYHLYLDYMTSGWGVLYYMPLIQKDEFWAGCPNHALSSYESWSPEDVNVAEEYRKIRNELNQGFLLSIEEATSFTLDEFYQQFKDPANTQCLETPMDLIP